MFQLSVNHDRWKVVDFAYPHRITTLTFITTLPIFKANSSFFYKIFQPYVWLLSLITMYILYYILHQFEKFKDLRSFRFWNMIEILFHQNFDHKCYKQNKNTLLIFCWVFLCTTLTMFYTNCIYSYMIIPSNVGIINTIDQLIQTKKSNEIKIFATRNNFDIITVSLLLISLY